MSETEDAHVASTVTSSELSGETICVAGLGYVGLSVAVAFDKAGWDVVGYDISESTIDDLRNETPTSEVVTEAELADADITFTTDPTFVSDAGFVIIAVPTPTSDRQMPNLDFVEAAGETVGANITPGTTVILESTVFPGATRDVLIPAIERTSDFTAGEEFGVGYSPERISPGDDDRGIEDVVKIVSGQNEAVQKQAEQLYGDVVDAGIHVAPSIEVAETMKVFENVQRDVNIALVNELAVVCEHLGLETDDILEAAGTKWNFHEYSPGLVGGHCIPVDPAHYAHSSERAGFTPQLVLMARELNEYMSRFVSDLTVHGLNDCGKILRESNLLVLGLSYKPNVGDIRTSKIGDVISELKKYDVSVEAYDPEADNDLMRSEFDVEIQETLSFDDVDGVILGTGHDEFESLSLDEIGERMNDSPLLVDVEGLFDERSPEDHGFVYKKL
jgi:UDP-N-acetyl-D-galactosamine dehydrogenase